MRFYRLVFAAIVMAWFGTALAEPTDSQTPSVKPPSFGSVGGYPKPMGFRRASWESLEDSLYQDHVVIGTATRNYREQEQIALEFKRRRPDARVQVQYFWNAFPRVLPFQIAKATNFRYIDDPVYYAFPEFNGFYLTKLPNRVQDNIPEDATTIIVRLDDTRTWAATWAKCHRLKKRPKGLLYALDESGNADFLRSEFVKIVNLDHANGTATLQRFPPVEGSSWHRYDGGKARIGLQVITEGYADMFYPNVTRFCPRDPQTGMNAAEFWARHVANYYRKRVSALDGLAFDVPPFAPHAGLDIDNDGIVDHGYREGINYLGLGLYDFFDCLRNGSDFDRGLGPDVIITADGEEMADQRFPDLTNGAENEDFPAYMDFTRFPEQFHLHLWWCDRARQPNASYPVMRFPTDAYHNPAKTDELTDWMHNNHARLGMATACFGNGVVAYESSRVWKDKQLIASHEWAGSDESKQLTLRRPHYLWDEYNAGQENRFRWLGQPLSSMLQMRDQLGPQLLSCTALDDCTFTVMEDPNVRLSNESSDGQRRTLAFSVRFDGTPAKPWTGTAGPRGPERLEAATRVYVRSGNLSEPLVKGDEYTVCFAGVGDSIYKTIDPKYKHIPLTIGLRLRTEDGAVGGSQWIYLDATDWHVQLTLVAPGSGSGQLEFLAGTEPGSVVIRGLSLRKGCGEVACRHFENGLVLMNASSVKSYTFDLDAIAPDASFRRIQGIVDPLWNHGGPEGKSVTLPPREALFLLKRQSEK